jgi:putative heme-binding domain-containing protein
MSRDTRYVVVGITLLLVVGPLTGDDRVSVPECSPPLKLEKGDHIVLIGNTLADRMQHDGWLETLLQSRFPQHELVIRNLGFSGDELTTRLRSANFGSPHHWLTLNKADVIFAFFGYNESFAGTAGLSKFKKDLNDFIKHSLDHQYNGKSPPRLVLFSPIAHENLRDRNLPDGNDNNQRLELYTTAMAEVARANQVSFVDLFHISREIYTRVRERLTINGIHLNESGNRWLAQVIDKALFPNDAQPPLTPPAPPSEGGGGGRDPQALEKLRQAVRDKNFYWFNRYRTVDGYSIYGGRADLQFVGGQTNRVVMQREMEILDLLAAGRDRRIWAVAQGGDLKVDDSQMPPFIPVITNKPGLGPNGTHLFLDGEEAIQRMTVGKGMKVNLFASEKEFPELAKPVQMSFDTKGRLWVAVWPSYPHWKPKEEMNDKILIFEDTKGTGKADKMTVFADHLHCPTGFEFWGGGVLVAQAPGLVFLKDTDGDDKADVRVRVLEGIDSADTHHTANSFQLDPGGALYFQEGTFHHTQVETPYGPPVRCANAGVYRYEPRTQKFDTYVTFGFANPHGHVFNRWGQDIVMDGTGSNPYDGALFSGHLDFPQKHARPPQVYQERTRPCPGVEILSSRHFPKENQGNLLVGNVIGFQGILQYKLEDKGSSLAGTEVEPIVYSSDPNFRPSDIKMGPDGAIYFLDWQNPIIGHMQHNLRDPSRDRTHGRIYRITYESRPLLKPAPIAGAPVDQLLDLLKEPEDRVHYRVRIELSGRDSNQVLATVQKWVANLDRNDPEYEHHLLEALWLYQSHNVVNVEFLKRMLGSPEFHARAAATRVLSSWRDRVPGALELLKKLAADPAPRVRLEAVRAASFFTVPEAGEVALISAEHPTDSYLDFTRGETLKALDPFVKKAIALGHPIAFTTPAGAHYFLKNVSTDQLLKRDRSRAVCLELLFRRGVRDEYRQEALASLAKFENRGEAAVLLDVLKGQESGITGQEAPDESVVFDLVRLLTSHSVGQLAAVRPELERLATGAKLPVTRQLGFVALIAADDDVDKAWSLARKSVTTLEDLLHAMPLIRDPSLRARLYPKVEPLLHGLPEELSAVGPTGEIKKGRYVRIELPGRRKTLTLAEVEVYRDGRNIALQGKASQKNTANGGDASKAIDGNVSGVSGDGGQSHTQENTSNPWWEVDLGAEQRIDSIVIYNHTERNLGKRLNGFTIQVLDAARRVVFEKRKLPAPDPKAMYEVSSPPPERAIRQAAMNALLSVRGQEERTFKTLAEFVRSDIDRHAAVQALLHIPAAHWPKEEARPLLDSILAYVRTVPAQERTSAEVLDAMQLGDALAALLPLPEAKRVRKEFGALGVRVLHLATVPDQMLFDKERLVVEAGKPVEFLFENNDLMPHNFVITQPGSLEEIGTLAESTATDPQAAQRGYVPPSKKLLLASRLIQPREAQRLPFTAPKQPGIYPYVCTYPGHWRRMYGALYVVDDLDQYQGDAESYLARHPLPIADELLKYTGPRKEWKFEELAAPVEQLDHGRSFRNGKQMFQIASCVACHKMNGVGTEIGPDLTKLDPKQQKPIEILRDILEPSFRINEKYQTYVFALKSGQAVTGLVLEETPEAVKVIENPLAKAQPVVLKKAEIEERVKSPTSIMPKGLLDKLSREEILDLIAYLAAGGEEHHKLFQGAGHDHGHGSGH